MGNRQTEKSKRKLANSRARATAEKTVVESAALELFNQMDDTADYVVTLNLNSLNLLDVMLQKEDTEVERELIKHAQSIIYVFNRFVDQELVSVPKGNYRGFRLENAFMHLS